MIYCFLACLSYEKSILFFILLLKKTFLFWTICILSTSLGISDLETNKLLASRHGHVVRTLRGRAVWGWRESLMIVKSRRRGNQDSLLVYKYLCMGFKRCALGVAVLQWTYGLNNEYRTEFQPQSLPVPEFFCQA